MLLIIAQHLQANRDMQINGSERCCEQKTIIIIISFIVFIIFIINLFSSYTFRMIICNIMRTESQVWLRVLNVIFSRTDALVLNMYSYQSNIQKDKQTHTRMHTRTHTRMHTQTHTRMHTQTHTLIYEQSEEWESYDINRFIDFVSDE